ncbi:unnamed protein product [Ixodes hexagonus]
MAAPPTAPAAAAEPTPMTPRPVVTDEKGYHYRWDISVGDTPSDLDWGEEIIKKDKKLSFEKDVRVQEFDKKLPSDEIVNLQRKQETKEEAELPETVHQEVLKRKKRKKKKKKKRKRPRKKYRFELGKPIKRDDEDDGTGGDEKKEKKKKKDKKGKKPSKKGKKRKGKGEKKKTKEKKKGTKSKSRKGSKGKGSKGKGSKDKGSKGKKKKKPKKEPPPPAAPAAPAPAAPVAPVPPAPAPAQQVAPGQQVIEQPAAQGPPLPSTGMPDGMIMITHERSSSSSSDGPFTERVRMVASPETFNRLSSREPPNLEVLLATGTPGEPKAPGQQLLWQALPQQALPQQALPQQLGLQGTDGQQRMVLEPGTTEQIVQGGPGGAQIKIRTKTEIEMVPPEEEPPPPPPRRGIEAITRQEIAEYPSPDGGEPVYTTSQENIIRRSPGRTSSRCGRRSRVHIPGTQGLSLSPDSRVIRTTTKKVEGPDGMPRMDTKVDISPPRQSVVRDYKPPSPDIGPPRQSVVRDYKPPTPEADVRYETQLLNQLSEMVRDRTERELRRVERREHKERRRHRREERRSRRARRRRSRRRRRSMGDVPYEPAPPPALPSVTSATTVFARHQTGFDGRDPFLEPLRSPYREPRDIVPAASVANALEQCCRMLENVADEFRVPPVPPVRVAARRSNRKASPVKRAKSMDSCVTTVCSWLGLSDTGDGSQPEPPRKRSKRARSSSKKRRKQSPRRRARRKSSSTRASASKRASSSARSSSSRSTSSRQSSSRSSKSGRSSSSRRTRPRRRRSRRGRRSGSRTSTTSGAKRFSKEFEFVTHITSKGKKPQETQKLVIVGRASEETISTAGRAIVGRKMYHKDFVEPSYEPWHDRVGDWDDYQRHDIGLRLEYEDRIDDRGDDRAEDREQDGGCDRGDDDEDQKKGRSHHKGRRRHKKRSRSRSRHSEYGDTPRAARSYERIPGRFSRYTAGYDDYCDVPLVKRVSSHTRVTLRSLEADPPMVRDIAPTPSEPAHVELETQDAAAQMPSVAHISMQRFIDMPVQEEVLVSNTVEVEPQEYMQVFPSAQMPPYLQASQMQHSPQFQVTVQSTYEQTPGPGSPSSSKAVAVSYSSLVESAESNSAASQQQHAARSSQVQTVVSDELQCTSPSYYMAPEHQHSAPPFPQFALPTHVCRDTSSYGEQHVRIMIEDDTCQDTHPLYAEETPAFFNQPPPQFLIQQHKELFAPVEVPAMQPSLLAASQPAPMLAPSPQYMVYSNPYSVYCGQPQPAHCVYTSNTTTTTSPLLHPMSTFTASAPVLVHNSRTYSEEQFYTDSSNEERDTGRSTVSSEAATTAERAAFLTSSGPAASSPMLLRSTATTNVLTRKPAFLEKRALHARGLEAKSSKLNLGQTVHTYDQWMANQARYEAMREAKRTNYQTHVIIAFLLLVAVLIGALALVSVYGKKQLMSLFGDYDSEYNQTMNSPWLKYFRRSFNFNGNGNRSKEEMFGLCRTPECRAEGLFVSETLNWTVNPCNDFYSFVCSDWSARANPVSVDQVVVGDIENIILRYFTEGGIDEDSLITPAKMLFTECVNVSAIQALRLQPLHAILGKTGLTGWPFESDDNRSIADVWIASAKILRYFGLPTLLTIHFTKVSRTSDAVVVLDKTNSFGSLDDFCDNVSVSQRSWDLLERMRVVSTNVPLGLAEEVFEFMHYVVRLTAPSSSKDGEEVRSLGDLNLFQPFVVEATGSSVLNISTDPVVLLQSSDYVSVLIEVIRTTPPHVSINYLGHVLTDHLRAFIIFEKTPPEAKSRAHVCLRVVERALPRMVHYAAYLKFKPTLENLSIRNIVDDLKHELMTAIAKITWMDVNTKSHVLKRLTETQIRAFFPHWMTNTQLAREVFGGLPSVTPGQALLSYQATREHEFQASLSEPLDRNDVWRGSVFDTGCFLDRESNNVYFPISLLNITGRTTQFFLLFQIPRIGVRLVGCLLRAALEGTVNGDDRTTRWSRPSRQNYQAKEDCFSARHTEWTAGSDPDDRNLARKRQQALFQDVTETAAIRPVLKLYKMYIMSRSRHRTDYRFQNAEGISTNQLFYVYYAASLCHAGRRSEITSVTVTSDSSARRSVNWPLMDDPDFESIFGCSQGTGMNPASKCRFW